MTSTLFNSQNVPAFEKDEYNLILEQNFNEREIAIIEFKSAPLTETEFSLVGPLSERFNVSHVGRSVYVTSIPCESECVVPKTFTLLLLAENDNSQQFTTLTFSTKGGDKMKFLYTPYDAVVQEETGVFEKALKVTVSDETQDVVYSVQDPTGLFSIHPKTGILMIQHPEFLTRSTYGTEMTVKAIATDKKTFISTPIRIVLKPKPEMLSSFRFVKSNYSFTVPPGQMIIGTVETNEADNQTILYDISEGGQGVITIDNNGTLMYHREPEKDTRNFSVLVLARSMDSQFFVATTWVNVTVEGVHSNPINVIGPRERSTILDATTKLGMTITEVEMTDEDDDAIVQLMLMNISGICLNGSTTTDLKTEMFNVNMTDKKAIVTLEKSLNDLPVFSITLTFHARDIAHQDEPVLIVTTRHLDCKKEPMPITKELPFKFFEAPEVIRISSSTPVGSTIGFIPVLLPSLTSPLLEYTYEIDSPSKAFQIDNATGFISISHSLDNVTEELLTITASDQTNQRSTQMNITVIVIPSKIRKITFAERQYIGRVKKTAEIGTTIAVVKAITDRGEMVKSYKLEEKDAIFFSVDEQGSILLKDSLTTLKRSELNFVVRAGDETLSTTALVHVVVEDDDEQKIFFEKDSYDVRIMENAPINVYVLQPMLLDAGHISGVGYSIETDKESNVIYDLLQIDSDGRITVKEELIGYVDTYKFWVRAKRGNNEATTSVLLHILESFTCIPQFVADSNFEFTIEEERTLPYHVVELFQLVLGLKAGSHQFVQMASTVKVLDVDDHLLVPLMDSLTVEVIEDVPLGTVIATMKAVDVDESQAVFYRLNNNTKEFAINVTSGEVTVINELDRETVDSYELEIVASNGNESDSNDATVSMFLHVIVTDVNDMGPLFEQSTYEVLIDKDTLPGQKVVKVSAFDPDLPDTDKDMTTVYYRIREILFDYHGMTKAIQYMFSIGPTNGIIQLNQSVSDFVGGVFHLLVESLDSSDNITAHKDQCIVKVYIHEDSDVVRLELPIPPSAVTYEKTEDIRRTLANATGLKAIVKDLQYHHEEGNLLYDVTDIRLALINRTTSEIIPAERAIAIADKHRSSMSNGMPTMTKSQVLSSSITHSSIPPIAYLLAISALSLIFEQLKKLHENNVAVANALSPPSRPMKISPITPARKPQALPLAIKDDYAVQEVKMVVNDDEGRR
ncbi:cadherin domain protein [Dictyocaulus viviparus]|uniref:Cadherin domain protein n=1 Tax=Dictyocaulus viviparus TaxID=29172 RepID=A0A0D8XFF3_DICVI|nr:cadherin domain protein [Dictyocaulus viviparus]